MGKKSSEAPDYSGMEAAAQYAAETSRDLGGRAIDFAERQYAENKPRLDAIGDGQIAAQAQQLEQGKDYFDYNKETFRPLEQGLVSDAQNFSSASYGEKMAGEASAAAGNAFANTQKSLARSDAARGLNPNSPAARAARQQASLGLAASRANSMTNATSQAEQLGWARRLDAGGLGRGLAGASSAAYQGSVGAGSAGANTYQAAGQNYQAGISSGAGIYNAGSQTQMSGLNSIMGTQTDIYSSNQEMQGAKFGAVMGLAGAGLGAMSDRRLKENVEFHHKDMNLNLNFYTFNYIKEPDRTFVGLMADEVVINYPYAVELGIDGYYSVDYGALNTRMLEITGKETA
ncbi:tail fiber domain-containing protein [Zhongshania aliphaticivorans]|jgi:hypothetical protein|uniref:tail fiber domain-containing protein n=1 Tax=Zhongshania aliphaticivorans TaxID=1470434 RepID=UPI0039C92255|tara:strand:- start:2627 stop:3661 length:1035 start_codon:yes stop_codon:yes gene_type:complete